MDHELVVGPILAEKRLDGVVQEHWALPRGLVFKLLRQGRVRVSGKRMKKPGYRLAEGDRITLRLPRWDRKEEEEASPPSVPAEALAQLRGRVVVEEPGFLLVNKPAGMVAHAGSGHDWGLVEAMRQLYGADHPERVVLLNRLDRDVSGLVILTRTGPATRNLGRQQQRGHIEKAYLGAVLGVPATLEGEIQAPLIWVEKPGNDHMEVSRDLTGSAKAAHTRYQVQQATSACSLLHLELLTGRKHQLRVHLRHLGHPLLGDFKYGGDPAGRPMMQRLGRMRLFLHAYQVAFDHPTRAGERVEVSLPLDEDLGRVWQDLSTG